MRRRPQIALALTTCLLLAGTVSGSGSAYAGGKKEKAEMAAAAKVTIEQAAKVAREKTAGTVIEAELEKKHGKVIWEVKSVAADGKMTETHIDAESGAVIETKGSK